MPGLLDVIKWKERAEIELNTRCSSGSEECSVWVAGGPSEKGEGQLSRPGTEGAGIGVVAAHDL